MTTREELTHEQEAALARQATAGDRSARDRLILSHLPLARTLARRHGLAWVPLCDRMAEAIERLIYAVDTWDPDLGGLGSRVGTCVMGGLLNQTVTQNRRRAIHAALGAGAERRLDAMAGDDGRRSWTQVESRDEVEALLRVLDPLRLAVVRRRFGLDGEGERNGAEIGRELAISTARVNYLLREATARMHAAATA